MLDKNVWEKLPIDLLEHVIAFLPIPSQTRFRVVNKHFNNWISSQRLDVLRNELPLRKYVVLWNSWHIDYFAQIGGFGNLQRPPWIFNNGSLQPFVADLSMWDVEIVVAKRCFVCIRCFAKDEVVNQRSSSNSHMVLVVLDLMNNIVHEIPHWILKVDGPIVGRVRSVKYDIAVHDNDRDFRFTCMIVKLSNVTVMKLYDSATNRCVKFGDVFPQREYMRGMYTRSGCTTFNHMFSLRTKKWTGIMRLTSFAYNLTDANDAKRIKIDMELPASVMEASFVEIKLVTTSDHVFILGLSSIALSLWEVNLRTHECIECEEFRIDGEESLLMRFIGAYSGLLFFGPHMVDHIDPLTVRMKDINDRMKDMNYIRDGMKHVMDRMNNMHRDCKRKLSRLRPLGYNMEEFKNIRGFGTLGNDSYDMHKFQSVGEFRVYDLKSKKWRDLTRIEVKSMSKSSSNLNDLHFEYFYDPCADILDS